MPTYTDSMDSSTQASATDANLLTNFTPTYTIELMTISSIVPYTRKLLYITLLSLVKSPKIDRLGAMYVCGNAQSMRFGVTFNAVVARGVWTGRDGVGVDARVVPSRAR